MTMSAWLVLSSGREIIVGLGSRKVSIPKVLSQSVLRRHESTDISHTQSIASGLNQSTLLTQSSNLLSASSLAGDGGEARDKRNLESLAPAGKCESCVAYCRQRKIG